MFIDIWSGNIAAPPVKTRTKIEFHELTAPRARGIKHAVDELTVAQHIQSQSYQTVNNPVIQPSEHSNNNIRIVTTAHTLCLDTHTSSSR